MNEFRALVDTSQKVAATRSRRSKIEYLAQHIRSVDPDSVSWAVAFLSGVVPQGALGVGWATIGQPPEPAAVPSLLISDVVEAFDALVATSGPGSTVRRKALVAGLLERASAEEQQFLFGLIGGEIRQGALEGIMVDAVAAAADVPVELVRKATMLTGRVWEAAGLAIRGGAEALSSVGLTLFRPVKPMLAQTAEDLGEAVGRMGEVAVEWKLDGIRIQVHRQGDRVEIYTRNLNPVTDRLAEIVDQVRGFGADNLMLDGEALYLSEDGTPARFQETAGRFGTELMEERGIEAFFFDVLHVGDSDVIDLSLRERRRLLEDIAGEHVIPHVEVDGPDEAGEVLDDALRHRHEGVMVKALESSYEAGRRGAAWLKVKPVHTLDLVVLAAEWGHGRRRGWLSNLHLGARGKDGFVMVGKTFKGMTDQLLTWQTEELQRRRVRSTQHAVFVRPELVVEVALDGVQVSTRYPGGVALRFARIRGYRPDKDPADADTIDTVRALAGLPPLTD